MNVHVSVVSHACVIAANQAVYAELAATMDVTVIVPAHWRDELRPRRYASTQLTAFHGNLARVATIGIGRPQRHVTLRSPRRWLRRHPSDLVIIEEEPFSIQAARWARAARRAGLPYAVQVAENRPRSFPAFIQRSCRRVLGGAAFVLARSPAALELARQWGYRGVDGVVVHAIEPVTLGAPEHPDGVVGFVGRLVGAKGVDDLVAVLRAHPNLHARVAGDGPRRDELASLGARVQVMGTIEATQMDAFYDSLSVVVVPSRTTPTWSEQFGRVVIEAQSRATPVVAYDSGELAWVSSLSSAVLVPEGDVDALGEAVSTLAGDHAAARERGLRGQRLVAERFTTPVVSAQLAKLIRGAITRP